MDSKIGAICNNKNDKHHSDSEIDQLDNLDIETSKDYFSNSPEYHTVTKTRDFEIIPLPEYQPTFIKIEKCIIEKDGKIKREVKCYKCNRICNIEEVFVYTTPIENEDNLICFDCSCNIDESRALKDWENTPLSNEVKKCSRCLRLKSINRFVNNNKYCSYCLLKKKWSRIKQSEFKKEKSKRENIMKCETEDICNLCLKTKKLKELFIYKSDLDEKSKYVCINCSVNLEVCRLHDWENKKDFSNGKLCKRCKKWKSKTRFNRKGTICMYCCLKRKRLYLLKKTFIPNF